MNHLADFVLMYEQNIEQAIIEKRETSCTRKSGGGTSNHAYISDPTAQKAMKNLMPVGTVVVFYGPKLAGKRDFKVLRNPEKWLGCVRATWIYFRNRKLKAHQLMVLRYKEGCTDMNIVAKELGISLQRSYVILNNVHRFLMSSAEGCGAYEVKSKNPARVDAIMEKLRTRDVVEKKNVEEEQITTSPSFDGSGIHGVDLSSAASGED